MADLRETPDTAARHPWETARLRFFLQVLQDAGALDRTRRVLDMGAGDAFFARSLLARLPSGAEVCCVDTGYAADATPQPGLHLLRQPPDGAFDLVTALDVAEHVEDDAALVQALVARLDPNGHVLFSVPAWPRLFTSHDTALHHHRRYTPAQGRRLLEGAGLQVVASGGLFHGLLLPRLASRVAEAVRAPTNAVPASLAWRHGPFLTRAVQAALAADNALSRLGSRVGAEIPGLSWWALCRK